MLPVSFPFYSPLYSSISCYLTFFVDRKILDMLPGRPPQVTFSCEKSDRTCSFQFWTAEVESFYCALEECHSETKPGYDTNSTIYACEKIKCSCVPGRFICGEDGSVGMSDGLCQFTRSDIVVADIGEFLKQEIKGPASFSCVSGKGCKFEEPAMNDLIDSIFGDRYITLTCEGGECLHYSQVPGYVVRSHRLVLCATQPHSLYSATSQARQHVMARPQCCKCHFVRLNYLGR